MRRRGDSEPPNSPDARGGFVLGAHWGFVAFLVGLGGYYLASLVLSSLVSGNFVEFAPLELHEVGPVLLLVFVPNLFLGLGPAIGSWLWGRGLRQDFGIMPTLRDVKVGLACGALALTVGYALNLVLLSAYGTDRLVDSPLTELYDDQSDNTLWLIIAAAVVVIAAPLSEELLARGALWASLRHYRLPSWVVLILTAVIFAYLHGEPTRTLALLGQGVAIGLARMVTGRVGASMIAHAANNLPPALLLFAG